MPGRIEKTVFISYRRTNLPWALAIFQNLKSEGYDVFFDYLSIPSGDFESIIVENIRARAHFIVILTPSALERCNEPGDWLRREIEAAMDEKRNIVPLMLESFDFGSPATVNALTGKLEGLKKYNGLRLHSEYFFEGMNRLRAQFLNVALDAIVHPISVSAIQITQDHQVAASEAKEIQKEELSAQEWLERGFIFLEANNLDEAIRCFTEAIRLGPKFAQAFNKRGYTLLAKGELDSAIKDFDEAIRLKRDEPEPYYNRGRALRNQDYFNLALADFTEAINLDENYFRAYLQRGTLLSLRGDHENALLDIQKASELEPEDGSIRASLIRALKSLGRIEEAKEQEQIATQLIQQDNEYNKACFAAICGNTEEALKLLKNGLEKKQSTKEWARQDPDFENIRDDPRFKELVGE